MGVDFQAINWYFDVISYVFKTNELTGKNLKNAFWNWIASLKLARGLGANDFGLVHMKISTNSKEKLSIDQFN